MLNGEANAAEGVGAAAENFLQHDVTSDSPQRQTEVSLLISSNNGGLSVAHCSTSGKTSPGSDVIVTPRPLSIFACVPGSYDRRKLTHICSSERQGCVPAGDKAAM